MIQLIHKPNDNKPLKHADLWKHDSYRVKGRCLSSKSDSREPGISKPFVWMIQYLHWPQSSSEKMVEAVWHVKIEMTALRLHLVDEHTWSKDNSTATMTTGLFYNSGELEQRPGTTYRAGQRSTHRYYIKWQLGKLDCHKTLFDVVNVQMRHRNRGKKELSVCFTSAECCSVCWCTLQLELKVVTVTHRRGPHCTSLSFPLAQYREPVSSVFLLSSASSAGPDWDLEPGSKARAQLP